jgi:hypothetical protein
MEASEFQPYSAVKDIEDAATVQSATDDPLSRITTINGRPVVVMNETALRMLDSFRERTAVSVDDVMTE